MELVRRVVCTPLSCLSPVCQSAQSAESAPLQELTFNALNLYRLPASSGAYGDYERLARLRPLVADRRQILIADGAELVDDGFPLLPTLDWPHWTVTLAAATDAQFDRVGSHFRGPFNNPAFARRR